MNMNKILSTWYSRYLSHPEALVLLVIILVFSFLLKIMSAVLTPIIVSVIFAYLLINVVEVLEKWRFPHMLAVILVFTLFVGLFLVAFLWLIPVLWQETANLVSDIPMILNRGQALILKLHEMFPEFISVDQMQNVVKEITTYLVNLGRAVVAYSLTSLVGVAALAVYLVLIPLLVFFFLRDSADIKGWMVGFLPKKRESLVCVWNEMQGKIQSYIQGKAIEVIIIAAVTIIAFKILDLRYSFLLGALVGLSVIIPYVGIVLVTVPVVVVGVIQWGFGEHFFYLMLVYTVITVLDANVLVPLLFSEVLKLHPLAIILAVLVFGSIFGFWGIFFAIPLVTFIDVLIKFWPRGDVCEVEEIG